MLEVLTKSIPKTTNEIIFFLGLGGLFFFLLKHKRFPYSPIITLVFLSMIIWRVLFRIDSGRYAAVLIYPFTFFAAFFLSSLIRLKKSYSFLLVIISGIGIVYNCIYKCFNMSEANLYLETLVELHNRLNDQNNNCKLITFADDVNRIKQIEKNNNTIAYYTNVSFQDICSYIENYRIINNSALYSIFVDSKEKNEINCKSKMSEYKLVLSYFSQKRRNKKMLVYKVDSANTEFWALSQNKRIEPESGILYNGDLELVDTPEQSYEKLKNHIGYYSIYYNFDPTVQTAKNAYFHNDSATTKFLPYYNCSNTNPISGTYSAKLAINQGIGFLLFYQRFQNGKYEFSLLVRGDKDTVIHLLYDTNQSGKWSVNSLCVFIIPDKRLYKIKVSFDVDFLNKSDYFLVGTMVRGTAQFDNFTVEKYD